jgi:hypothetical protein
MNKKVNFFIFFNFWQSKVNKRKYDFFKKKHLKLKKIILLQPEKMKLLFNTFSRNRNIPGEMAERSNAAVLKTVVRIAYRGFESLSLRKSKEVP